MMLIESLNPHYIYQLDCISLLSLKEKSKEISITEY
jgi:hypothetical protein